ncbi:MAG: response regulator transcription factor [Peptococcaceae bacterium]|nr:response regulator transcription factor [Peptococcaceae bacterium]
MAGEKILVVDDEAVVQKLIAHYLAKEGFQVITADTGYTALEMIRREKPDLILLDILLPELDGLEICQEIRSETNVPIIFITSKGETMDVALGLGVGGDDYVRKPFDPLEVVARVKAHLRRHRQLRKAGEVEKPKRVLDFPDLKIDLTNRTVEVNGLPAVLTAREFDILALLAENPNRFYSADKIMELVWKSRESVDYRSLMVHISKLRKKIEEDPANPKFIISVRGFGYKFSVLQSP